jgi:hypothetical protein
MFGKLKSSASIFILLLALHVNLVFGQKCKTTGIKRTDINGSTWLLNNVYNSNQELVKVTINQVSYPMTPYSYDNVNCNDSIRSLEFDTISFYKYKRFVAKDEFLQRCYVHWRDTYNDHMYDLKLDETGRVVSSSDSSIVGFIYYMGNIYNRKATNHQFQYLDSNIHAIYFNDRYYDNWFVQTENGVSTFEYESTINANNMTQFNISDTRLLFENNKNHIKSITTINHVNSYGGDTSLKSVFQAYSYVMDSSGCIVTVDETKTTTISENGVTASSDSLFHYTYYYSENPLSIANPFYANQNRLCAQLLVQRANDVISIEKLPSQSALEVFNISGALLSRFEGQEKVFLPSQNSPLILHLISSGQSCSKIIAAPF